VWQQLWHCWQQREKHHLQLQVLALCQADLLLLLLLLLLLVVLLLLLLLH
jgi:hypothetical protein